MYWARRGRAAVLLFRIHPSTGLCFAVAVSAGVLTYGVHARHRKVFRAFTAAHSSNLKRVFRRLEAPPSPLLGFDDHGTEVVCVHNNTSSVCTNHTQQRRRKYACSPLRPLMPPFPC